MTLSEPAVAVELGEQPSRLRRWVSLDVVRGAWAMGDQAVVSIGNFATNILLGRKLTESDYGSFGLMLDMMFFLNSLQAALIVYPLQLKGPRLDRSSFRSFATGCLFLTVGFSIPLAAAMAAFSQIVTRAIGVALLAAAVLALWQIQELLRRALMAQLRFAAVVWGDAIRYCGLALGVMVAVKLDQVNLPMAFAVLGLASALAAVLQALQIGLKRFELADLLALAKECWVQGRWVMAGCLTTLLTLNAFAWALSLAHGKAAVGQFLALGNPLKFSHPLMIGITGLITPAVASAHARHDARAATRGALRYAALGAVLLLPYFAALVLFPGYALRLCYGKESPYLTDQMALALQVLVVGYMLMYIANVLGAVLNGLAQSRFGFYAQVWNSVVMVAIAIPLVLWLGVMGAVLGWLACVLVLAACHVWFLVRVVKHDRRERAP